MTLAALTWALLSTLTVIVGCYFADKKMRGQA